jgi:alkylation response protein AidB-like acyl-CoA dehydrogenase
MEFALSEDQRMLQDSLRSALTRACPLERVRAATDQGLARDDAVWAVVCELGVPALLVPEAHGGLGLTLLDAALAAEELGRRVAPVPFLGSAVLATLALREAGSAEQQRQWLPRLATGAAVIGVALAEALGTRTDGSGVHERDGRLHGSALFAVDALQADALLVATSEGTLFLVEAGAKGLRTTALRAIDATRPMAELRLDGVAAQRLPGAGPAMLQRLRDAAWVMSAADTLGAGWAMIEQWVAYARDRRQFGRAIGSFQAVKHLCAEMAAELEIKRSIVWYAAHAFDERPDELSLYAAHAKALLGDAGRFVARTATEVHGGMGVTDELGLHHWFKRIGMNRQLYGGPERVRRQAAALQPGAGS